MRDRALDCRSDRRQLLLRRKNGEFSVMIGFVEQRSNRGWNCAGTSTLPDFTYASLGGGCWKRDGNDDVPHPCRVSAVDALAHATLTQSRSKKTTSSDKLVQTLKPARVLETYSAGIKLALVARAEADVYLNTYRLFHDWDICAGHILVEEAGGNVSGLQGETLAYGEPGNWQRHGVLATNGLLHAEALAAKKE